MKKNGLIFFIDTITSDSYEKQTLPPFFKQTHVKNTDW
jgi:hypothetical protein